MTCWIFPSLFVPVVTQEEVYREAVTDGYIIDNFYLNSFTTESPKTPRAAEASQQLSSEETDITEASGDDDVAETSVVLHYGGESTTKSAWSTQQPSLESKVNDLLEGTEDTTNTAVFHHHGGEHHVSTTTGVPPAWSTQQSKESDLLEGSGDTTDVPVFLQDGNNNDISTTSVSPAGGTEQPSIESKENDLLEATGDTNDTVVSLHHGGEHYEPATSTFLPVWNTQQPQENDLLEGSGDTTDVYVFLQNGSERDITTAMTAPPAWTRQQPPSVSEGSDSANESGHSTDPPIVPHHGRKHDVSATASVTQARSPSADVLPGDTDDSGSGDIWSSDGEIIHSTTSPRTSVSYTEMSTLPSTIHTEKRDEASRQLKNSNYLNIASVQSGKYTKTNPITMTAITPSWLMLCIVFCFCTLSSRTPQKESYIPAQCRTPNTRFV